MGTYNNTFGGNFIQPSTISYNNIVLISNVDLAWPTSYQDTSNDYVLASYMTVQASLQPPIVINLENNPIKTTDESSVVTVTVPSTENLFSGTQITINGSTDVNGITAEELNITVDILEIQGSNSFTYTSNGTADDDGNGGGNNITLTYNIPYAIKIPDATQVSRGTPIQFINNGANPFFIVDNGQNFLVELDIGNVYQLLLTDNSTSGGEWQILEAGTGTAFSNAYQMTGLGLKTINGTLNTNFPSKTITGDYTSTAADRGSLIIWNGGVGTINLFPNAPVGFPESINNSGGGIVTVSTTDGTTIDGKESFPLNPGESSQFISTSEATWNSLGFGKETFFAVNTLSLNIGAGGIINLTNDQASRLIQTYTGALLQDAIVNFPAATGEWYVWNNTTNNFTVTLKLFGDGNSFIIPQGEKLIVYSEGTSLYFTPTTATNAIFNPGNEGSPTIVFTNDATTGFYGAGIGDFGFSSAGTLTVDLASYGLGIKGGKEARFYNTVNNFYAALKAGNIASNVTWTLPLLDATNSGQIMYSNAAGLLNFTTAVYPTETTINEILYSSADNTIVGSDTLPNAVQLNITSLGTIVVGVWNGTTNTVPYGGTGLDTFTTPYGLLCAGITATGNLQNGGTGTVGQIPVSNGADSLFTWQLPTQAAIKADQIAATSNLVYTNPLVQQDHPSAAKFICVFNGITAGTNPPLFGYNVASVTRNSVGAYTINFIVPFSTPVYGIFGVSTPFGGSSSFVALRNLPFGLNNVTIGLVNTSNVFVDSGYVCVIGFGTQ